MPNGFKTYRFLLRESGTNGLGLCGLRGVEGGLALAFVRLCFLFEVWGSGGRGKRHDFPFSLSGFTGEGEGDNAHCYSPSLKRYVSLTAEYREAFIFFFRLQSIRYLEYIYIYDISRDSSQPVSHVHTFPLNPLRLLLPCRRRSRNPARLSVEGRAEDLSR